MNLSTEFNGFNVKMHLYRHVYSVEHRDPRTGFLYDINVDFTISNMDLDEFTTEAIVFNYVGDYLLSRYYVNLLPTDPNDAIILVYNRQSVELMDMKRKYLELVDCEYLVC